MWGRIRWIAAAGAALLGVAAAAEDGSLYQWTDEDGVVRYTPDWSRVPRSARDSVVRIGSDGAPVAEPSAPVAPGALPAVMGSDLSEELRRPDDIPPGQELDRRIEQLREAIARDQKMLRDLVASDEPADDRDARIRAVANRLPPLQAELERLERIQRERSGAPVGPAP